MNLPNCKKILVSSALVAAFFLPASAIAFDAELEYGPTNPSGPWSYGYTASFGSPFIAFDVFTFPSFAPAGAWQATGGDQFLVLARDVDGDLFFHPGPGTERAVLRFTAPTTASYSVSVQFIDADGGDTSGHVLLNGDTLSPLAHFASTVASPTFTDSLTLNSGDLLDIVVGNNGDYFSDSTGLSVRITAIPEPAQTSLALGLLGLAGAATRRRRDFSRSHSSVLTRSSLR